MVLNKASLHWESSALTTRPLLVQKADKGNTVVIIDEHACKKQMKAIVSDQSKF